MDNTGAYADRDLDLWKRWIILDKENNGVIILDQVSCNIGDAIDALFHPLVSADIDSKNRCVNLDGEKAHMKMKALATSPFSIRPVEQKYVMQMTNFVPVDIPCYSIHVDAKTKTTCLASIFYPKETTIKAKLGGNPEKPSLSLITGGKHIHISANEAGVIVKPQDTYLGWP